MTALRFLSVLTLLVISWLLFSPIKPAAADQTVDITINITGTTGNVGSIPSVTYGSNPTIIIVFPFTKDPVTYTFFLASDNNNQTGKGLKTISLLVSPENNTCTSPDISSIGQDEELSQDQTTFTSLPFSGGCKFETIIKSNKLIKESDTTAKVFWVGYTKPGVSNHGRQFAVTPKNSDPCSVFSIGSIYDHATQQLIANNTVTTKQVIDIYLNGIQTGTYTVSFSDDNKVTSTCNPTSGCTPSTTLTIPEKASSPLLLTATATLDSDHQTYSCSLPLTVSDITSPIDQTPEKVQVPEPIIDPTPTPPLPPCKVNIYSTDGKGCTSIFSAIGDLSTDSFGFIGQLFAILLSISGGIALLLIIRSGYQLMTSQGNPEKVKEARERLTSVFVGLLFLVLSIVILEVIGVDLLSLPGLTK